MENDKRTAFEKAVQAVSEFLYKAASHPELESKDGEMAQSIAETTAAQWEKDEIEHRMDYAIRAEVAERAEKMARALAKIYQDNKAARRKDV